MDGKAANNQRVLNTVFWDQLGKVATVERQRTIIQGGLSHILL
jgi:hypothetical protein